MLEFDIMDWDDKKTHIKTNPNKTVAKITIEVITGDEIANVEYSDYSTDSFDSSTDRMTAYYDGSYVAYDADFGWRKGFEERKTSYTMFH